MNAGYWIDVMKWYKHLTGSLDSPDIEEAIEVFGGDGYLVFFGTLEIMADEFDKDNPGTVRIPLKHLTKRLQLSAGKTLKILKFFGDKNRTKARISFTLDGKYITLNCPKLKELCDEWTQRQLRSNSGDTREPLPPIEEEVEEEVEEDNNSISSQVDWEMVLKHWNMLSEKHGLKKMLKLNDARRKKYRLRCKELGGEVEFWNIIERELPELGEFALTSGWFGFDFLVQSENNFLKFREGRYRKEVKKGRHSEIPE